MNGYAAVTMEPVLFFISKQKPVHSTPGFDNLLLFLLTVLVTTTLGSAGLLALHTTGTATAVGRGEGEVNVLLGVETDHVGRNVDDLLADTVRELVFTLSANTQKL